MLKTHVLKDEEYTSYSEAMNMEHPHLTHSLSWTHSLLDVGDGLVDRRLIAYKFHRDSFIGPQFNSEVW